MKRLLTFFSTLVIAIGLSVGASAQHGKGRGKPATTGLEHAETTANPHGQKGIENAETKQAAHKKHKSRKHKKHNQTQNQSH